MCMSILAIGSTALAERPPESSACEKHICLDTDLSWSTLQGRYGEIGHGYKTFYINFILLINAQQLIDGKPLLKSGPAVMERAAIKERCWQDDGQEVCRYIIKDNLFEKRLLEFADQYMWVKGGDPIPGKDMDLSMGECNEILLRAGGDTLDVMPSLVPHLHSEMEKYKAFRDKLNKEGFPW